MDVKLSSTRKDQETPVDTTTKLSLLYLVLQKKRITRKLSPLYLSLQK